MVLQLPEPDAYEQALHAASLIPTDADKADLEKAREWERKIREDQQRRDAAELLDHGYPADSYQVRLVRYAPTEPGW
ncbi:hypothetical protein [Nocardiopsis tropica]|uniref:Uncharacterized protein n=1 Tax=Nocardiopsis tropica TaxID=109330 RepID=A0ABU7KR13_9ACTN|nr:hypothetical protein [Nocardiopsis umidischolae]MEE2051738.1 hypothetical protein [Nocardiopsis umidischolae]